ncbi:hypothetical protein [Parvibaculum sp.]|jgi:hypothetical protein|uniref:hypothetical protein n=1 Tax=Parvibaculum sp. TaxID=2024848 RepID=UPI002A293B39|nr:hypothetical protein [Parvibaculum sp.]
MPDMAATMQAPDELPQGEVTYSRAAYEVFQRLDSERRALVRLAASAQPMREIAPGLFSSDAGPGLRVVFMRDAGQTSVLALTGGSAA